MVDPSPPLTPEQRLARHLSLRRSLIGVTIPGRPWLGTDSVVYTREPVPTKVPPWALPGAWVACKSGVPLLYRVVITSPLICLLETEDGQDNPIDTSLLAEQWGPAPCS